jgi:hypothetical protein
LLFRVILVAAPFVIDGNAFEDRNLRIAFPGRGDGFSTGFDALLTGDVVEALLGDAGLLALALPHRDHERRRYSGDLLDELFRVVNLARVPARNDDLVGLLDVVLDGLVDVGFGPIGAVSLPVRILVDVLLLLS